MNAYSPAQVITEAQQLVTPAQNRLERRKCACGGTPGPTGECAKCRRKRLQRQRETHGAFSTSHSPTRPANHHFEFDRIKVYSNRPKLKAVTALLNIGPTPEAASEDEADKFSPEGLLMLSQSGTCVNGGGSSVCNPASGDYELVSNNNTCCTKDCTQQHEQTHINDVNGWGCCKALSVAYNKKGANKSALIGKYNAWLSKVVDITECNAYTTSVKCADALSTAKDCAGKGKTTDCCKDVIDYRARMSAHAKTRCAKTPKKVAPCPSF